MIGAKIFEFEAIFSTHNGRGYGGSTINPKQPYFLKKTGFLRTMP
jgi:hypothetical protein